MRSSIVVLKRSRRIAKQEWREPSCDRTLVPIDVDPLIRSIWQANQSELPEQSFVELSLQADGSPETAPSIHSIQGHQKAFIGVFSVSFVSRDRAEVILLDEKCSIQLGTPRRRTRQIGLIRPWKPARVLLNGRCTSSSGQYYVLQEYHLALCNEPAPDRLEATRLVDLQADLM